MAFYVHGIGVATPPHALSQDEAVDMARQRGVTGEAQLRRLQALYRMTGVESRHSVLIERDGRTQELRLPFLPPSRHASDRGPTTQDRMRQYEQHAPQLASAAARAALADAGWSPRDVTHLVTVSCTGFAAPGFDVEFVRGVELAPSVERAHVGFMGCHAALNGLRVAKAYADSIPEARVLVCAVELCSLHFQYGWNPQWLVANAIFADGAAALAGSARAPDAGDTWQLSAHGSMLLEASADLMAWRIGDHGFEMSLSARVPGIIERELRPWLDTWLESLDLDVGRIASWALHPGGPRILEACVRAAGIPDGMAAVSRQVLRDHGNMSSPTLFFILDRMRRSGAPRPCVALGFGPGLAVEAALFR